VSLACWYGQEEAPEPLLTWAAVALSLGDYFLALTVFAVISVTWWRGVWNLLDYYVYPDDKVMIR
jgi:hypothetical protein